MHASSQKSSRIQFKPAVHRGALGSLLSLTMVTACADDVDPVLGDDNTGDPTSMSTGESTTGTTGTSGGASTSTGADTTDSTGTTSAGSSEGSDGGTPPLSDEEYAAALQAVLDGIAARPEISGTMAATFTPRGNWAGAAGNVAFDDARPVSADDALIIHSVSKTMTGVLSMLAVEEGLLALDEPVAEHLPAELLAGVHVLDGVDRSDTLTLRQLLSHRTGLADYFFDGGEPNELPPFIELLFSEPERTWTPTDMIEWAKETFPTALDLPNQSYHYSDTNYVLVGMVLESVYGESLEALYQSKIFAPLGMEHTWMLQLENPKVPEGSALTHVYFGDVDLTSMRSMTADWGGGGLVSTAADLHRFMAAIVNDELFSDPASNAALRDYMPTGEPGEGYGLGIMYFGDDSFHIEGHGGAGGAFMMYSPQLDSYFVGTTNQAITDAELIGGVITQTFGYLGVGR